MSFFDEFIVRPILNLLMAIYSIIPDFGVSIIIFTIIVRLGEDQKTVREESTNA